VPGYHGQRQQPEFLKQKAYETGYPVMIKAVAGGGGRGMRIVNKAIEFEDQLVSAKREALAAFGDETVLIERYLNNPRHIEIQVFGDSQGNVVHLFERDCSVQRRHQKVIEEAPAPGLPDTVRQAMGEAAVKAARAVGYQGAGTVEFIADGSSLAGTDGFFFMEMNTRLQVEHPVTEMITGLDLVEWQLRIVSGEPLPLGQDALAIQGHAMEARIYAEDPAADFQPAMGRLWAAEFPNCETIRVDTGVATDSVVSPFYDSMLAKLVVHGQDRKTAVGALRQALSEVRIAGVKTNIAFLGAILDDAEFGAGGVETGFVDRNIAKLAGGGPDRALAGLAVLDYLKGPGCKSGESPGPWADTSGFEIGGLGRAMDMAVTIDGNPATANLNWDDGTLAVSIDGRGVPEDSGDTRIVSGGDAAFIVSAGGQLAVSFPAPLQRVSSAAAGDGHVRVPMHGRVASISAGEGERIAAGDLLFTLEAMKMEHSVRAPVDGVIGQVLISVGEQVDDGASAIVIEPAGEEEAVDV
jgi:3-methylcrotonyl-CoA carboxylase alpha subunit